MSKAVTPQPVFSSTGNRVAAIWLDLLLVTFFVSIALPETAEPIRQSFVLGLFFFYFFVMPLTPLQGTLGKWVFRIKLCDRNGQPLRLRASVIRALLFLIWFCIPFVLSQHSSGEGSVIQSALNFWLLLFALPWVSTGFMPRQESLFDLIAGTLVVRYKADAEQIVSADQTQKHPIQSGIGSVLICLIAGALIQIVVIQQQVRGIYARVSYAIGETRNLRSKIEEFYAVEQRWPSAKELGIPDWNPYPAGGGYSLKDNGSIVITFSVLPELKGRSITFSPRKPESNQSLIKWQCKADAGLEKHCR